MQRARESRQRARSTGLANSSHRTARPHRHGRQHQEEETGKPSRPVTHVAPFGLLSGHRSTTRRDPWTSGVVTWKLTRDPSSGWVFDVGEEHTTAVVQHYLDALAGDM